MRTKALGTWAAAVAALGVMLPPSELAAAPNSGTHEIALQPGGVLVGQVVDPQGVVRGGTPVSIEYAGHEVVRTTTDEHGMFAAKGLRDGQYQLKTVTGTSNCYLYAASTAPPSARSEALLVSSSTDYVVRGQAHSGWRAKEWAKRHPYLTAGTVLACVAVPLVLADNASE